MTKAIPAATRTLLLVLAALVSCFAGMGAAQAQSGSCGQLEATLQTLERNRAYQLSQDSNSAARTLQRDVQRNESRYIRNGCNADAKAGRSLTPQCRALGQEILAGREEVANLSRTLETGNAIARQREAILQEMARFNCGGGSRGRVLGDDRDASRRGGNLFEQLFDAMSDSFDGEGGLRGEEFGGYVGYHTVRTLCVRKSDGFYWPISYSTLTDYVQNDLEACRAQCPGQEVDLYYHDNPGQEVEQAINVYGEPYTALPSAFRFRTEIDREASCRPSAVDYGSVTVVQTADGSARSLATYNGLEFPLPRRDPRARQVQVTTVVADTSAFVDVPLPRRRPAAPGETPRAVPVAPEAGQSLRIVQFGDKRVRVVGPDTPYAPTGATGT